MRWVADRSGPSAAGPRRETPSRRDMRQAKPAKGKTQSQQLATLARSAGRPTGEASEPSHMTASAFATQKLREAILNGELEPGDRLEQHFIAAKLVPFREAAISRSESTT